MKTIALLFLLTFTVQALAHTRLRQVEPARIVNERGEVELWTWTQDYRGHPKVTIRNLTTGAVRVFVF